jgi:hypothetical protein
MLAQAVVLAGVHTRPTPLSLLLTTQHGRRQCSPRLWVCNTTLVCLGYQLNRNPRPKDQYQASGPVCSALVSGR